MKTQTKTKTGRKPLSVEKKKKAISIVLTPKVLEKLLQDTESGKADSPNQMAAKIIARYYQTRELKNA